MVTNDDTIVVREKMEGYVQLLSLNPGDEFETESSGGVVKWVINNGSAKAVGVVFDGCKTEVSIVPTLLVKKRKPEKRVHRVGNTLKQDVAEFNPVLTEDDAYVSAYCEVLEELSGKEPEAPECGCDESVGYVCEECARASMRQVDLPPVPVKPVIRVVPIVVPIAVTTAPEASKPADPNIKACKFDLTLTEQQITLLHYKSATDLFCAGLYNSWSKETFFAVCKAKFPQLKCGQDFQACCRQINLYRSLLRKSGKNV